MLDLALFSLCAMPLGSGAEDGTCVNDVQLAAALHA